MFREHVINRRGGNKARSVLRVREEGGKRDERINHGGFAPLKSLLRPDKNRKRIQGPTRRPRRLGCVLKARLRVVVVVVRSPLKMRYRKGIYTVPCNSNQGESQTETRAVGNKTNRANKNPKSEMLRVSSEAPSFIIHNAYRIVIIHKYDSIFFIVSTLWKLYLCQDCSGENMYLQVIDGAQKDVLFT